MNKLFKSWKKDNKKSGYGKYAETNVSEFWAETVTKAIHGKSDKYTKKVKGNLQEIQTIEVFLLKLIQCNMEKIELTADEIKVIKQQLNGEIEVWNADDYQQKASHFGN